MSETAADLPESNNSLADQTELDLADVDAPAPGQPHLDLGTIARNLRAEGMTRSQIARSLAVSTWRVTELLAGEPPRHPGLRARAKDDLRARARELRAAGKTYGEIVEELGVSKSSVSLWTGDLPKPPRRQPGTYEFERIKAMREARWAAYLAERDDERQAVKSVAERDIGELSERELLLIGVALYWAEGAKDKPYDRRERLQLINSDPDVIRLHLEWLTLLGVQQEDLSFSLSIHESADVPAAERYWRSVVGEGGRWRKASLKRHNPRTVRKNVGQNYHGCLVVHVRRSRVHYQRMEGFWRGIVDAVSQSAVG